MEFVDLQLTDGVEKIVLGIILEANVSSGYGKHFEEIHRAVKDDIRKLQSDHELHKEGMQSLRRWHSRTSGVLSFGMIAGSGIILWIVWKERSRARVRSRNVMELGTLNDVEPRVSRQQVTERENSEAFHQQVREGEASRESV